MKKITKEIFLNTVMCPTLGWMFRNPEPGQKPLIDLGSRFRMEEGIEIGKRARNVYPEGVLIDERDSDRAILRTREVLSDNVKIVFEGAFGYGNYIARADILKRVNGGWHLIEVKSSVNDKPELLDDLAYTVMVCQKAGLDVKKASLFLLSKDYRLGMDDKDFFIGIEHPDAFTKALEFSAFMEQVDNATKGTKPDAEIVFDCRKCDQFDDCVGKGIKHHIFELPRISENKFNELNEMGVYSISEIPEWVELSKNQKSVAACIRTNSPIFGDNFDDMVNAVSWPAYYLDFETVMTAIPLYPEIAPFTQIPTQYSIHKCSDFGKVEKHFEYLADSSRDCRRELALNLIEDLEGNGSIVCYSSFEKTTIGNLAKLFPDLENELNALIARLYDLEKVFRESFYHPDFHGKTSIKQTLPALVPGMNYEGLEIGNGSDAIAAFAYMAMDRYSEDEMEKVRKDLLLYCKQDTLAMVRLHGKLHQLIAVGN